MFVVVVVVVVVVVSRRRRRRRRRRSSHTAVAAQHGAASSRHRRRVLDSRYSQRRVSKRSRVAGQGAPFSFVNIASDARSNIESQSTG